MCIRDSYTVACDGGAPPPPGFSTPADSHALVPIETHVAAFEVLDRNVHLTKTTKKPELRGFFCPAVVQACYVVCGVPDDGATEILVHHFNESPEICDLSGLGTLQNYHQTLRRWEQRSACTERGCLRLSGPQEWRSTIPLPWAPSTCPVALLIERLHSLGWRASDRTDAHLRPLTADGIRTENLFSRKSYLLCLLHGELLAAKEFHQIAIDQPESYYKCLLALKDEVEPGHTSVYYSKALKEMVVRWMFVCLQYWMTPAQALRLPLPIQVAE